MANAHNPTNIHIPYTVEGLSKLLLFNAYAKANSENIADLVMQEAKKYPYTLKKEREVRKLKLNRQNEKDNTFPSIKYRIHMEFHLSWRKLILNSILEQQMLACVMSSMVRT